MKLFGPLYARALVWSRSPRAPMFLFLLSIFEAVFFPVAPEVMLGPMCLSQPRRGFWFALLSLLGSMIGALIGYALGHYAFDLLRPTLTSMGWIEHIDGQVQYLRGLAAQSPWKTFWVLVLAGFAPIPLKFFTWASGIVGIPILPFMASMTIGRGKRVFAVALLIRLGGERAEAALRRYIEPIGWGVLVLIAAAIGYLVWRSQSA
jgi:membrane protein YqaA with SNARE-associated domain